MTDTWDDDDRAIARALGADVPDAGPADPGAVADYEAVLGYLPFEEVPPRDLEDQVVAAALARRPAAARSLDSKRAAAARRKRSPRPWIAAVATVAAAVVIVILVAGSPGTRPTSPGAAVGRIEPTAAAGDLARVRAEPDARRGLLRTAQGETAGRVVLDAHGDGYLTDLAPPAPSTGRRWLWLDTASGPVRVGPIGRGPVVRFTVRGDVNGVRGVLVTPSSDAAVSPRMLLQGPLAPA